MTTSKKCSEGKSCQKIVQYGDKIWGDSLLFGEHTIPVDIPLQKDTSHP
jgi:hypothetical protein